MPVRTETLTTPDVDLVYDVRDPSEDAARRPPLLMAGHPMDAGGFKTLASFFPDRVVVSYDPRGLGRSVRKDGRDERTPQMHATRPARPRRRTRHGAGRRVRHQWRRGQRARPRRRPSRGRPHSRRTRTSAAGAPARRRARARGGARGAGGIPSPGIRRRNGPLHRVVVLGGRVHRRVLRANRSPIRPSSVCRRRTTGPGTTRSSPGRATRSPASAPTSMPWRLRPRGWSSPSVPSPDTRLRGAPRLRSPTHCTSPWRSSRAITPASPVRSPATPASRRLSPHDCARSSTARPDAGASRACTRPTPDPGCTARSSPATGAPACSGSSGPRSCRPR